MPSETSASSCPALHVSTIPGIPLYLIPRVVADQIKEKREMVFQITITRARYHYYTIAVTTSEMGKSQPVACPAPAVQEEG